MFEFVDCILCTVVEKSLLDYNALVLFCFVQCYSILSSMRDLRNGCTSYIILLRDWLGCYTRYRVISMSVLGLSVVIGTVFVIQHSKITIARSLCLFTRARFECTCVDSSGRALQGVTISVHDWKGTRFYGYPVSDYLPDRFLESDVDGKLVFYHLSGGFEWESEQIDGVLWKISDSPSPRFRVRFLLEDRTLLALDYVELQRLAMVSTEAWKEPVPIFQWPVPSRDPIADLSEVCELDHELFDYDGDGRLSLEESVAYRSAEKLANMRVNSLRDGKCGLYLDEIKVVRFLLVWNGREGTIRRLPE